MSKFKKGRLVSAMLCTLLFGGNAGAMQKDVSKGISKIDKLKDNLSKGQTKDKDLENRKPGDSSNPLLKYVLYVLGGVKLADEGVGVAQAKNYIGNKKLSPLGKLSLYKFAMAKYYKTKTIETMRNLVAESRKNAGDIKKFFDGVINKVSGLKDDENGCFKVKDKKNLFDISSAAEGEKYFGIKEICRDVGLTKNLAIPEYVEEYVKAVLGVSVEQCDRILVNVSKYNKYIAFVKDNVCLKLSSPFNYGIEFRLTGISEGLAFDSDDYSLDLDGNGDCYAISLPYMEKILGVKHDEHYINIKANNDKINNYSFYGQIFRDLDGDWKGDTPSGKEFLGDASKIFPELFKKEDIIIKLN